MENFKANSISFSSAANKNPSKQKTSPSFSIWKVHSRNPSNF